jgi:hypothetical protein
MEIIIDAQIKALEQIKVLSVENCNLKNTLNNSVLPPPLKKDQSC